MSTEKHGTKLLVAVCAALLLIVLCASVPRSAAHAATDDMSEYGMSSYDITCTVNDDCTADVSELITLSYYSGRFTRTLKADGKTRIRDVKLYKETTDADGEAVYAETAYSVKSENKRTATVKAKTEGESGTETFLVTYRLTQISLTKNKSSDMLQIINIGSGWSQNINANRFSLTLGLPEGFLKENSLIFHGTDGDRDEDAEFRTETDGTTSISFGMCEFYYDEESNSIIYEPTSKLKAGTGVSFWLNFDKGVLTSRMPTDFIQWLVPLLIGLALLAGVVAIRFTVYKDREIFSLAKLRGLFGKKQPSEKPAPEPPVPAVTMDPVTCRRVLERKIEDRDVVSLLFHWAQQGYIKISLKSASNPVLIKNADALPDECPDSWKELYGKIFERTDRAGIKSVAKFIYPLIANIRAEANKKRETGYAKKPAVIGCVFALLASLCAALYPLFMPAMISSHAVNPVYLTAAVPALLIFVFFAAIFVTRNKNPRNATIAFTVLAWIYSAACVTLYCVFVPSGILSIAGKIITAVLALATIVVSSSMILRSDEYAKKLNEVEKIRDFILNAPQTATEKAFAENPYIYYELLPYALLLRIGVPWSEKFKGYTMPAPDWLAQDEKKAVKFAQIRETIKGTYDVILDQTVTANTAGKKKKGSRR